MLPKNLDIFLTDVSARCFWEKYGDWYQVTHLSGWDTDLVTHISGDTPKRVGHGDLPQMAKVTHVQWQAGHNRAAAADRLIKSRHSLLRRWLCLAVRNLWLNQLVMLYDILEITARYAGLLLAPVEGFGLQSRLFFLPNFVIFRTYSVILRTNKFMLTYPVTLMRNTVMGRNNPSHI